MYFSCCFLLHLRLLYVLVSIPLWPLFPCPVPLFVSSDPQAALWLGASIGNWKPGKSFATQMVHAEQGSSGMDIDNAGGKDEDLQDEHSTWFIPAVHCSRQQGVM